MLDIEQKITHSTRTDGGMKYYNFALLHSRGLSHVFDTMRYDSAFFARKSDVTHILEAVKKYGEAMTHRFSILLAKYDWRGATQPNWTPQRLLSDQEFQEISISETYDQNADFHEPRPPKPLKVMTELEITGTLPYILQVMYDNRAYPAHEPCAHAIERAFYSEEQTLTVTLANYQAAQNYWRLPKGN